MLTTANTRSDVDHTMVLGRRLIAGLMLNQDAAVPADVDLAERRGVGRHRHDQRGVPVDGLRELLRLRRRQSQNAQADLAERLHVDAVGQRQLRRARLKQSAPASVLMIVANHHHRRHADVDDVAIEPGRNGEVVDAERVHHLLQALAVWR